MGQVSILSMLVFLPSLPVVLFINLLIFPMAKRAFGRDTCPRNALNALPLVPALQSSHTNRHLPCNALYLPF
ncbi:hypothetical protein BGZ57DRAFT_913413 [Hyaloscypha finlandica]|nr:hypothetical protein BGZ57DRAFT_913413 [Hyaloscypha finlandica]